MKSMLRSILIVFFVTALSARIVEAQNPAYCLCLKEYVCEDPDDPANKALFAAKLYSLAHGSCQDDPSPIDLTVSMDKTEDYPFSCGGGGDCGDCKSFGGRGIPLVDEVRQNHVFTRDRNKTGTVTFQDVKLKVTRSENRFFRLVVIRNDNSGITTSIGYEINAAGAFQPVTLNATGPSIQASLITTPFIDGNVAYNFTSIDVTAPPANSGIIAAKYSVLHK